VLRYSTILAFDTLATFFAFWLALSLRLEAPLSQPIAAVAHLALPILVCVRLLAILGARLHHWSFKMSGLSEAARLGIAALIGSAAFAATLSLTSPTRLPRSVYVLEFFFSLTFMTALRFAPRLIAAWHGEKRRKGYGARAIIVGAGNAGDLLARDIVRSRDSRYWVLGFVDDDPAKLHTFLVGKPVLGRIQELPQIIEEHGVDTILLAIPRLPAHRIREILSICASSKASFKIMPASFANLDRRVSAAMLHDLSPQDLLPRDAIAFDAGEIRMLVEGRRALVTGAGGSIGGEICRQLAMHGAAQLVMVDMNENELYLGLRRLQRDYPSVEFFAEVADIRELPRLQRLGERYEPEYVFHAAAHKHVPLMEDAPEEAVKNNVFGTVNVAQMAHDCGAERLVVISTDKAVRPTSVMGATKRVAELAVRDLARHSRTQMTAVRFGNVLGSAGSVVPIFKEQIARGGPVTVTHPDCTRYFMTIPEAVGLVLLAGLGGYGELCVLDMGEPIRIADMAKNLITMAGLVPDEDVEIVFTGLRPGEKLYEELLTEEEEETHEVRNRIMVAQSPAPTPDFHERLRELRRHADTGDRDALLRSIKHIVPTYRRTPAQPLKPAAQIATPDVALAPVLPIRKVAGDRVS
jgi:FlaA1/EpsC-like NDP-sugar epimerase